MGLRAFGPDDGLFSLMAKVLVVGSLHLGAIGEVRRHVSTSFVASIIVFCRFREIHHWTDPKRFHQSFCPVKIGKGGTIAGPRLQREDYEEEIGAELGIKSVILRQILLQCFQLVIVFIFQIKRLRILVLLGAPVVPLINQDSKDHNKSKVLDHEPIDNIHQIQLNEQIMHEILAVLFNSHMVNERIQILHQLAKLRKRNMDSLVLSASLL